MRIVFACTQSHLPQRAGGIESNSHDLCVELRRLGDEPAVLAGLEPGGLVGLVNRVRRKLPFGPDFPADRVMGYPTFRGWDAVLGAPEVASRWRPHVAVAQGPRSVPLAEAFLATGTPAALYLHDVEFDRLGGEVSADPRLLVLANSNYTAARAADEFGVTASVVPPLVRPEAYRLDGRVHAARSADGGAGKVLYVNPHPWKGVDVAFDLAARRPDVPFLFIETWKLEPDRKQAYRTRAAELGNVEWSEPVKDMREVYARTRVLLAPSQWEEAWGRVVTEAQVNGIPVLASDRGGLPESVGPGGLLVAPDAPGEAWATALGRVWDDPAEYDRLSRAALDHAARPEIQPATLAAGLRGLLADHAAAVDG